MRRADILSTVVVIVISGVSVVAARDKAALRIAPGPKVMSADEKAIVPDAARGAEQAVILSEETESDESMPGMARISYHMRAKILSNEARSVAEIEIPASRSGGELRKWWGMTVLPDGNSVEMKDADLTEQEVVRFGNVKVRTLKGALPSVAPGCVIDLGWVVWVGGPESVKRVQLQRKWPVRERGPP